MVSKGLISLKIISFSLDTTFRMTLVSAFKWDKVG